MHGEDEELGERESECKILECISYYWLYTYTIDLYPHIHTMCDALRTVKSIVDRA